MQYMQYIIALVESLAWPLTVLAIAGIVRKPLMSLIPSIQRIKFRDAEVEFFSKTLQPLLKNMSEDSDVDIDEVPSDERLYRVLKHSPGQTVLEAWIALEHSAKEKVENLLPSNESFESPLERAIEYLEFKGALTPTTLNAIHELRSLRNQVAHFGEDSVTKENAIQYVNVAEGIMKTINGVTELPKVMLTAITLLILELNSLIDSGRFNDVTLDEVYEWIRDENVIHSLAERTKGHSDLSIYSVDGPFRNFVEFYHEQMKGIYDACAGDHERKWGVRNSGLCLLLAWTNQLIQQGSGWHPDEM